MKKNLFLALLIAMAMLLAAVPVFASAEEPITLQWYYINDEERNLDENDWLKREIEDAFNVRLELVGRPAADQNGWYQKEIAAGTEFDFYEGGGLQMKDYKYYVDSGLVMPLDREMIEKNMPNLMAYHQKYSQAFGGDVFKWYEMDGKYYSIPETRPGDAQRNVIGIRGDWLDNLGLEVPHTIEEFENVLDAFTYGDPDGNGIDDTYGFTGVNWNAFSLSALCQAFGFNMDVWYVDDNGTIQYGTVQPEMKDMLALLQKWYKAGYFPCDFWNQGWDEFRSQLTSGVVGMAVQAFDAFIDEKNGWALADLLLVNPDAHFELAYGMEGPNGKSGALQFNPVTFAGIMFSYRLEEQPEKLAKYMQVFDALLFDPEWVAKAMYGQEGVGYTRNDAGDYVKLDNAEAVTSAAGDMIIQLKEFINDPVFDRSFTGVSDPEYTARANEAFENAHGLYDISASAAASREKNEQYSEALGQIISSYLPEIISGERPIDDFDRMVEEWYAAGGQEVVDEMNAIFVK